MSENALPRLLKQLGSLSFFFRLTAVLAAVMVLGTLKPDWDLYHQPWFLGLLALFAVNTAVCVGLRLPAVPLPSLISHLGILAILAGGALSLGLAKGGDLQLRSDGPALDQAVDQKGKATALPFAVKLKAFELETYGEPRHELRLKHQWSGWQRSYFVEPGKRYETEDKTVKFEVLAFNPDFVYDAGKVVRRSDAPNNPALKVRVTASPARELWVFQNYPGIHQDGEDIQVDYVYHEALVKQYKSRVEILDAQGRRQAEEDLWVNKPLRYGGYTLYQSSYDPADLAVSVLSVRRDPGVGLVYAGFAVLLLGLGWNTLRRLA